LYVGSAFPPVRLAESSHHRQTRHVDSLAPHRLPFVLEVQVSTPRTTSHSHSVAEAHCRDSNQQSNPGARSASPTNYCSRLASGFLHALFGVTCRRRHGVLQTRSNGG